MSNLIATGNHDLLKVANEKVRKMNKRQTKEFGFKSALFVVWSVVSIFGLIVLKQKGIL